MGRWHAFKLLSMALFGAYALGGCASIPKGQYGVESIEWLGMHDMAPDALAPCLVTRERQKWTLRLGLGAPSCGQPPFDSAPPKLKLWAWPWTDWPVYDSAIFMVDRERIERWYRARGYYGAHLLDVRTYAAGKPVEKYQCDASDASDCKLHVIVRVSEGKPVHVTKVSIDTQSKLPTRLLDAMRASLSLHVGDRFDEAYYTADKDMLRAHLAEASFAKAQVEGRVVVAREARTAQVEYKLKPGPACVFGKLRVVGAPDLPQQQIVATADIPTGKPYRQSLVADAQRAIFALGVFSAVRLQSEFEGNVVNLVATLQKTRIATWQFGVGMLSGSLTRVTSDETNSVPEWDVHLSASYDNKNFLGGLRRLRLEDRPALVFLDNFPGVPAGSPRVGNVVSLLFEQPGALERRTQFVTSASWDLGPDPYEGFFRNDIAAKLALRRTFWSNLLTAEVGVEHDLYYVLKGQSVPEGVTNYKLPFLEQQLIVDARNNPVRPRLGAYVGVGLQEAFRLGGYGSWDYLRVTPDVRGYLPLLWGMVLAGRMLLGALFVFSADPSLPESSALLGPQVYRLRGGGANGDRGFLAGRLGAGLSGGSRRWEASLELRMPLGSDVGLVVFGDTGDVNRETRFRFNHLNASTGLGLRYYSILGALRLDAGWRIPGLQVVGGGPQPDIKWRLQPSAVHFTIGEAF